MSGRRRPHFTRLLQMETGRGDRLTVSEAPHGDVVQLRPGKGQPLTLTTAEATRLRDALDQFLGDVILEEV